MANRDAEQILLEEHKNVLDVLAQQREFLRVCELNFCFGVHHVGGYGCIGFWGEFDYFSGRSILREQKTRLQNGRHSDESAAFAPA